MKNSNFGKFLYGLLFVIVIPAGLYFWSLRLESLYEFPDIKSSDFGIIAIVSGLIVMLWGMAALYFHGKGLPMNAFPPPVFVEKSIYRVVSHPIYWGFTIFLAGIFFHRELNAGFWLVVPITAVGLISLVFGYERLDLKLRFPDRVNQSFFRLPEGHSTPLSPSLLVAATIKFLLSLGVIYFLEKLIGPPDVILKLVNKNDTHFQEISMYLGSAVILIASIFGIANTGRFRNYTITMSLFFSTLIFLMVFYRNMANLFFAPELDIMLKYVGTGIFLLWIHIGNKGKAYLKLTLYLAFLLFINLYTNNELWYQSILLSLVVMLLCIYWYLIWQALRRFTENIANSWKEWRFGKIRIINHGFYAGGGAFLGILLAGYLAGSQYAFAILVFGIVVTVFSALWAQIIEGSEKLKRPFGYYGALIGIAFASFVVWLMGFNVWVIIAVISVIMPWVQAFGRLRCLVNGCCHGAKTENENIGIRYFHHRSRVCGISGLKGEYLHPTPLYSILWLLLVGFVLLSIWSEGFSPSFIFGMYLILTGLGRFVEEAYRGEVQTPVFKVGKGLSIRLYQWTAVASVVVGILMTIIETHTPHLVPGISMDILIAAFFGGVFVTFAMGVDFPESNKRFSRLV